MKVIFNTMALVRVLNAMKNVAACGIKLEATDTEVTVYGISENREGVKYVFDPMDFEVEDPGEMVVDYKYISESTKKLDGEKVTIKTGDGVCMIYDGKSKYKLRTMKPEDFPAVRFTFDPEDAFQVNAAELKGLIQATKACVSAKETRPVLTGINLVSTKTRLIATATDSYRLAQKAIGAEAPAFNITVPIKAITLIEDVILKNVGTDNDVAVSIAYSKDGNPIGVFFAADKITVRSRLLDGKYPETFNLIPKEFVSTLAVDRKAMRDAIERPVFLKTDNGSIEKLSLNQDDIKLSANASEIGASEEAIMGDYEGNPLTLSFNALYILDALKALEGDVVKIQFAGEAKPFVLVSESDENNLQLCLPVRTRD